MAEQPEPQHNAFENEDDAGGDADGVRADARTDGEMEEEVVEVEVATRTLRLAVAKGRIR